MIDVRNSEPSIPITGDRVFINGFSSDVESNGSKVLVVQWSNTFQTTIHATAAVLLAIGFRPIT